MLKQICIENDLMKLKKILILLHSNKIAFLTKNETLALILNTFDQYFKFEYIFVLIKVLPVN